MLHTYFTCTFHFTSSAKCKPKNFVSLLYLIIMSWNIISGVGLFLFCQAWNDIAMVLSGFITSLFKRNQLDTCCITSFIILFNRVMFVASICIFISSANKVVLPLCILMGRSFIYNRNKTGPRTEPWGTPPFISFTVYLYLSEI